MGKSSNLPKLDLHGYKKDDVFDAVDKFIMKHHSAHRICIVPGKGSGVVKAELISYLKQGGYPWAYEKMDNGKINEGSIIVFMND